MAAKAKKPTEPVMVPGPVVSPSASPIPSLNYADLANFGRDNIEAAVKTNAALSAGLEAISKEVMVYARSALKSATETARSLLDAKTLEDVMKLQTDLAKRNFEGMVAGSVKLSELGVSLASEAFAPWEGRVEATMAQFAYPQPKRHAA